MVAHKVARIAWVAVTIAGGDRCHGISNAARRDPQTRWKSRRLRALCTHRRRNRGQNPARSPHRRNPVLDANLQSPSIVSASKLDSLLYAGTRSGRQMHHYVRLSPDGDIKVTIHQ